MHFRVALGWLVLWVSTVPAAEPLPETQAVVGQRDQVIALRLDPVPEDATFLLSYWFVDLSDPPLSIEQFTPLSVGVAGQPGEYRVVGLLAYQSDAVEVIVREYVITVEGARPPPDEPDEPEEPDEPDEPGKRLAVVVYETADQRAPIYLFPARDELKQHGHPMWIVDQNVVTGTDRVPAMLSRALDAAKAVNYLPALVVCKLDGEPLRAVRLPGTAEAVVREVME